MLEQPLPDGHGLLDLEGDQSIGQARCSSRPEQMGPFEGPLRFRQRRQTPLGDLSEECPRGVEIAGADRPPAPRLPGAEELFEDRVEKLSALERCQPGGLGRLLLEPQDVGRVILEGTLEIPIGPTVRLEAWSAQPGLAG
jgi:hypothetical protein